MNIHIHIYEDYKLVGFHLPFLDILSVSYLIPTRFCPPTSKNSQLKFHSYYPPSLIHVTKVSFLQIYLLFPHR